MSQLKRLEGKNRTKIGEVKISGKGTLVGVPFFMS